MEIFIQIFTGAVLVEAVWETIQMVIDAAQKNKTLLIGKVGSLVVGLIVAVNYSLDLPAIAGLHNHFKYLGVILTGILISRGAQFVHDLIKIIENGKNSLK